MLHYEYAELNLRDFEGLVPTNRIADWDTPNPYGYTTRWITRIVFETDKSYGNPDKPIIEFYSASGTFVQFVSSYYIETLLGEDDFGSGYGNGLDLMGYEPHWKITAEYMDEIREWAETEIETL